MQSSLCIDYCNINTIRLPRHLEKCKHKAGNGLKTFDCLEKFFLRILKKTFSFGHVSFIGTVFLLQSKLLFSVLGEKHRYIFDKSVVAKQMSVVEAFGLLLFRVDKGKEFHSSKLYVFRLTDFEEEEDEPKTRQFCKNHRVDKSKGNVTEKMANYTIKLDS